MVRASHRSAPRPLCPSRSPWPARQTVKLLAKRNEIEKLAKRVEEKGLTLVPLAAYFSGRYLKIEVGVARGRKTYDKRHAIKEKETKRRMKRPFASTRAAAASRPTVSRRF